MTAGRETSILTRFTPRRGLLSQVGGGTSGCAIAGVGSGNTPISTDLFGGLPGNNEMVAVAAILGLLVVMGRWAFHRVAPPPAFAGHGDAAIASDSDELWREFDRETDPAEA